MLNGCVEIDESRNGAGFDDSFLRVCRSERSDGIEGLPTCQHQELDPVADWAFAEVCAEETWQGAQFKTLLRK
jgi:hypothetical protein